MLDNGYDQAVCGKLVGARVLVTGGAGLVGSRVARDLAHLGARVTVVDTGKAYDFDSFDVFGVRELDVNCVRADLAEVGVAQQVAAGQDYLVHCAAHADVAACIADYSEDFRCNVLATQRLLEAALIEKVKRFVFVSSTSIYGNGSSGSAEQFVEGSMLSPLSTYANSKLWGENQTRLFHELYGLKTCSVRYFSVYGSPQVPKRGSHSWCVAIFAMRAMKSKPIVIYGDGRQTRDFVHVDEVAKGTILALTREEAVGSVFNLGTGTGATINEVARLIRQSVRDVPVLHTPPRKGDPIGGWADVTHLNRVLGWVPTTELQEGIAAYATWLKRNEKLIPDWV